MMLMMLMMLATKASIVSSNPRWGVVNRIPDVRDGTILGTRKLLQF